MALDKFGVAHATTTLARGNLVDALDQLGEREEARQLLEDSVKSITEVRAKLGLCVCARAGGAGGGSCWRTAAGLPQRWPLCWD